nr:hypothetical protein [Tanacetum cinerariifolium]
MKESHPKEIKMTGTTKAKENALNVEIQITSSENVQNYQETIIKEPSLEEHGVIATKMEKKGLRKKNVLWLKHPMRGRHFTSSSFAFDQPSYSHLNDDDDDDNEGNDEGTSCASTPSPTRFVNSLTMRFLESLKTHQMLTLTRNPFTLAKPKSSTVKFSCEMSIGQSRRTSRIC